jgi:hypothetical protein
MRKNTYYCALKLIDYRTFIIFMMGIKSIVTKRNCVMARFLCLACAET